MCVRAGVCKFVCVSCVFTVALSFLVLPPLRFFFFSHDLILDSIHASIYMSVRPSVRPSNYTSINQTIKQGSQSIKQASEKRISQSIHPCLQQRSI